MYKNTFVFTDCHGCGDELEELLKNHLVDNIISLGDNFDRAFEGVKVWNLIKLYNIRSLLGNHELKLLKFLKKEIDYVPTHYHYFLNEFKKNNDVEELIGWLENLPTIIVENDTIFVHAGINPYNPEQSDVSINVYGRYGSLTKPWWELYNGDRLVCYGHISNKHIIKHYNYDSKINSINLDTSACHGNKLSGLYITQKGLLFEEVATKNYFDEMKNLDVKEYVRK